MRPQKHASRAPPGRPNEPTRELCTTIPDDRGDESFADDLNMGRGIVSGRVALLLRSTEIPPHRPKDFPFYPQLLPTPFCVPREYSPRQKFLPCGRQRARGPGSESKEGKTTKERKRENTWEFPRPGRIPSFPKSFPPLNGCKLGPGAQPPGPAPANYRNFRRRIFPPNPLQYKYNVRSLHCRDAVIPRLLHQIPSEL